MLRSELQFCLRSCVEPARQGGDSWGVKQRLCCAGRCLNSSSLLPTGLQRNAFSRRYTHVNFHFIINRTISTLGNRICRQIQDLHASFGIKERMKHRGQLAKLHIPVQSFYPQGSKLNLFSLYGQRFPRYWHFFQTCHIWA